MLGALWLLSACHPSSPSAPAGAGPASADAASADRVQHADDPKDTVGVTLTAEQVGKLDITIEPAKRLEYRDEAIGYGVVVAHEAIAQAAADLITAEATARLSRSSLARAQKLKGTPGAVSSDVEEAAVQKSEVDAAALMATQQRLSSIFGMNPPWKNAAAGGDVQALARGTFKLLRATFPLGVLTEEDPTTMRAARIGAVKAGTGWRTTDVWAAPADSSVPGRSFFGLLKTAAPREGERLQIFAPVGVATSGVVVPLTAIVLSGGKYWCYVQKSPGTFGRVEVDTGTPVADGYFVKQSVADGDHIVTRAAGELLATETGAPSEPE